MIEKELIVFLLTLLVVMVLSAVPLYIALQIMNAEGGFLRVVVAQFVSSLINGIGWGFFGFIGGLIAIVLNIVYYRWVFDLSTWRVLMAWLIQFLIVALVLYVLVLLDVLSLAGIGVFDYVSF